MLHSLTECDIVHCVIIYFVALQWAVYARIVVRKEKGLPIVIDRLRTENDQIVRVGAITLTNLAEDSKNKDLIGKHCVGSSI